MDEQKANSKINEQDYPGVDAAYGIAMQSYEWAIKRLDSIHNNATNLIAWATSVTLAIVGVVASLKKGIDLSSCPLIIALLSFGIAVILSVVARVSGYLALLNPADMYLQLHKSDWHFKKDRIYFAGEHWKKNARMINTKGRLLSFASTLLFIEALALIFWFRSL